MRDIYILNLGNLPKAKWEKLHFKSNSKCTKLKRGREYASQIAMDGSCEENMAIGGGYCLNNNEMTSKIIEIINLNKEKHYKIESINKHQGRVGLWYSQGGQTLHILGNKDWNQNIGFYTLFVFSFFFWMFGNLICKSNKTHTDIF